MSRLEVGPFGNTGLRTTPLALASMATRAYGSPGLKLSPEDVEAAYYEHGVNTFVVHPWMRPIVEGVSRLIRDGHRDRLVLISEGWGLSRSFVERGWASTVRPLGIDCVDIYLLAWLRGTWAFRHGAWEALRGLREAGRVRAIGFSTHKRRLAAELIHTQDLDVVMIRYNAAHRGAERDVFEGLGADRPAIIAYTATRWGLLLKPLPERGFPEAMTAGECYRFVLGHPSVDLVLCAARTRAEIAEDVEAVAAGSLDEARHRWCRDFGDTVHQAAQGGWRWMFHESKTATPQKNQVIST